MSKPGTLEEEIEHRILTGDAYPDFMRYLRAGGMRRGSGENVNISTRVNATRGGWIGWELHVMFPDHATAIHVLGVFGDIFARWGFTRIADTIRDHLKDALANEDLCDDSEMWPRDAGPLTRRGQR